MINCHIKPLQISLKSKFLRTPFNSMLLSVLNFKDGLSSEILLEWDVCTFSAAVFQINTRNYTLVNGKIRGDNEKKYC